LAHSKSRISLHGIEVPSSLFPDVWSMQKNQVSLKWPMPILLVVDICGAMDLDLNSSRTQILMSEKWLKFEAALAFEILSEVSHSVDKEYWEKLKDILLKESKNEVFKDSLNRINF
ncbi:MAG: metal-dependent phosphohydrolase, partial [Nitrosomonas sp.]|nr:metal-dependent phosphohydrolase [Nitrosomonas sp.]